MNLPCTLSIATSLGMELISVTLTTIKATQYTSELSNCVNAVAVRPLRNVVSLTSSARSSVKPLFAIIKSEALVSFTMKKSQLL